MIQRKYALLSIISTVIVIFLLASQLPKLEFDYNFENFFPIDDPDLAYYREFTDEFGFDNDYLIIALSGRQGIFNQEFVNDLKSLTRELQNQEGTLGTLSPMTFKKAVKSPMGYVPISLFHPVNQERLEADSVRLSNDELVRDLFFSKNFDQIKIMVVHERFNSPEKSDQYLVNLKALLVRESFKRPKLVGRIVAQKAFLSALKIDFQTFLLISFILVTAMLILFMRKFGLVIMSLSISGLSILATLGFIALTGKKIDILSTLIPSILLVVSMSDIVHLFSAIRHEYSISNNKQEAIKMAIKKVGLATFLTSTTTALGFLTLMSIQVKPIISLGIYSAVGILLAFAITYLMFPQIMLLTQPRVSSGKTQFGIDRLLNSIQQIVFNRGKLVYQITVLAVLAIAFGISQLKVDAKLMEDLPDRDQIKIDFMALDEDFGGSKPFTMSIWSADSTQNIYSKTVINEIAKLEKITDSIFHVNSLVSPVTYVKCIHQSLHGGKQSAYSLPSSDNDWKKTLKELNRVKPWEKLGQKTSRSKAQISGFDADIGSAASKEKTKALLKVTDRQINQNIINFKLTGTTVLINKSNESLAFSLLQGIFIAVLFVGLISGFMFRSWRMVFISLVPNIIPILAVGAAMGYLNIPINMGSAVIFAISFGIVVDDSIHFLSKYRLEKAKGLTNKQAISNTLLITGEAIILTTAILTIGFMVFCFSAFKATFYVGLFVSVSFLVALVSDLFLLPVLILRFLPEKNQKQKNA